ncbi:hypothetical protein B9Z55_016219 [Caenorhabditis nigoni]|nr:hypothetical protein B9Z55_016219 [Caenorhabditis nigoni]
MSNLEQLEQSEQLDKSDKYEKSEKSEQSEKLVLTVRKRRRLGKRDREKRRRMLGMENVTRSRTSAEYRSKLKNETQKVIDSLKATHSKPGQKLRKYLKIELDLKINPTQKDDKIETGNVMIVETSEHQSSSSKSPEKPSSDNIEQIGGGTKIDNSELKNPKNPESPEIFWDSPPLEFDQGDLVQKPFKAEQIEFDRINNGEFETPASTDKICVSPSLEFEQNGSMEVPENNGFEGCDEIVTDLIDEPEMDKFQKNVEILGGKSEGEGDGAEGEGVSNGGGHQGEQMKEEYGGGFSDWIKYNRELKKNQPPPEVPKV